MVASRASLSFEVLEAFLRGRVDFDAAQATSALGCLRRNPRHELELVNAVPNRFRLRALEATLVELNLALPESLRRFVLAALGDDQDEVAVRRASAIPFMCACNGDADTASAHGFAA